MNFRRDLHVWSAAFGVMAAAFPIPAEMIYNVRNYGATGNGVTLDTAAIQSAVNAANAAGGGIVSFPPGAYKMTGVRLTNNITVVFTNGAFLLASTNRSDWSGAVTKIFYATNSRNLTLTGPALMDGGGLFFYQGNPGSVISGKTLSHMLEFHYCTNVTLSGLHLQNSCEQTITFNDCSNVTVLSVTVTNRPREFGSGDDGIDFSDCAGVFVSGMNIQTGDDGICVKTETNHLGAHDLWIENCTVATTTMATKIGTATYSPAYNIVFSNITVNLHPGIVVGTNNPLPDGRCEAAINLCMCNGGFNHDIIFTHYTINLCSIPIYAEVNDRSGNGFGISSNIFFGDINCLNASNACQINVQSGATNQFFALTFSNLTIHNFETYSGTSSPPYQDGGYPYGYKIGNTVVHMPAYGLFARYVKGLTFAGTNQFFDDGNSGRPNAVVLENVTTNFPSMPTNAGVFIFKADNPFSLDQSASWAGGVAPGNTNTAVWDSMVATAANCTNVLNANAVWGGIEILNPATSVKIVTNGAAVTLSLGSSGINLNDANTSQNLWLALPVMTVADQSWSIKSGRTLIVGDTNQNVNLSSDVTVNGDVAFVNDLNVINGGALFVPDGATIEPADNAVTNAIIQIGNNAGGGSVVQTGGTVKVKRTDGTTGNPKTTLRLGSTSGTTGIYNISGGSLLDTSTAATTTMVLGDSSSATGILNVSGTGLVQIVGMRLGNGSGAEGVLNLTNGNVTTTGGTFDVGRASAGGNGTINVYGGTLTIRGTSLNVPHGTGHGTVNLYGGSINVGTSVNLPDNFSGATATGNGVVNLFGGTLTITNALNFAGNNSSGNGTVNLNGGALVLNSVTHGTGTGAAVLNLNGGVLKPTAASGNFIPANVTVNVGTGGAIIDTAVNITIPSPLLSGVSADATDGGLTKLGSGTLTLSAVNTYTGPTVVSSGTLIVTNAGALANSANISVASGGTLNISGVGALPLNSAPSLAGTLIMRIAKNGGVLANDSLALNGDDTFFYGGTLTVTAAGNPLSAGDTFQLFDATSFGGSFAAINLPALTNGLTWDVSGLSVDGTIKVVGPPLVFNLVLQNNATNMIIRGTGGPANMSYLVICSTNLSLPMTAWTPIATNQLFDANGNFDFTNIMNLNLPACFFALLLPPTGPAAPPPTNADTVVTLALQNMRDEGFNPHLPAPGGLYINWVYVTNPPPTMVNVQSSGVPDPDPTTRHDRLTDLEYLAAMSLFKRRFPADTQFDAEIGKYTTICLNDGFLSNPDERGWTYFAIQDIALTVPSATNWANAQADKYYNLYTGNLAKYGDVIPLYTKFNARTAAAAAGYYRVDNEMERACVLIVNGRARNRPQYIAAGENLLTFQRSNSWSAKLNLFPKQMAQVFTDSNKTAIAFGNEVIDDAVMKPGEIGEVCWALCLAEQADPGHGYGAWARSMLDNLQPAVNGYGLWDSTYGGYWNQVTFNGTNIHATNLTLTLSKSYKEVGRYTVVMRAFLAANATGVAGYSSNTLATIHAANIASYYVDGHGWTYQSNGDFSRYKGNNWVTSEAISHACCSILAYELAP